MIIPITEFTWVTNKQILCAYYYNLPYKLISDTLFSMRIWPTYITIEGVQETMRFNITSSAGPGEIRYLNTKIGIVVLFFGNIDTMNDYITIP